MNSTIIKRDVTTESQMQNRGCPQRKKETSPLCPLSTAAWPEPTVTTGLRSLSRTTPTEADSSPPRRGNGTARCPPPSQPLCSHAPATPQPPGSHCLHISPLLHARPRHSVVRMAFGCRPSERSSLTTCFNKPDVFQPC